MLEELGLEIRTTKDLARQYDESQNVVRFSSSGPRGYTRVRQIRRGMRVPLAHMEEAISLWPAKDLNILNILRTTFANGTRAASDTRLVLLRPSEYLRKASASSSSHGQDGFGLMYGLKVVSRQENKYHPSTEVSQLVDKLFPIGTSRLFKGLARLIEPWEPSELFQFYEEFEHNERDVRCDLFIESKVGLLRDELQVFTLGYYYALLLPLLNTSHLTTQEAYGSWGWADNNVIYFFKAFVRKRLRPTVSGTSWIFPRHEILRVVAYLFAGAEEDQLDIVSPTTSIGMIGKLSLLDSSVLGGPCAVDEIGQFVLLDIDTSAIPSNARGLVSAGKATNVQSTTPSQTSPVFDIERNLLTKTEDFTSHIEPDWEHDVQACLVVYRYKGRIIHKVNVRQHEKILWDWICDCREERKSESRPTDVKPIETPDDLELVDLDSFHGGNILRLDSPHNFVVGSPDHSRALNPILVPTYDHPKAFFCILSMYAQCDNGQYLDTVKVVSSPEEVVSVLARWERGILISSKIVLS